LAGFANLSPPEPVPVELSYRERYDWPAQDQGESLAYEILWLDTHWQPVNSKHYQGREQSWKELKEIKPAVLASSQL